MDALTSLLCLAIGIALPISLFVLTVRRGFRQLAVAEAYHNVARRLGLPADTRGVSLQGHLGVQRLWVGEVMLGYGPERRMVTWGVLDHERALGLGLDIRPRRRLRLPLGMQRALDRLGGLGGTPEVRSEEDWLLDQLSIRSDEPGAARELARHEAVSLHLPRLLARWRRVVITDNNVQVHLREPLADTGQLQSLVEDLRRLSAALVEARESRDPPAALVGTEAGWARIAEAHGLALEPAYPAAGGAVEGRRIRVWPASATHGYTAELRVVFRPHRPLGLKVAPQVGPDGYWSVGQDIQMRDPAFDGAFVIKGWDPEAIRELLHDEVRELLLALSAHGRVDLDDVRLRVRDLSTDPDTLLPLVGRAVAAAVSLGW